MQEQQDVSAASRTGSGRSRVVHRTANSSVVTLRARHRRFATALMTMAPTQAPQASIIPDAGHHRGYLPVSMLMRYLLPDLQRHIKPGAVYVTAMLFARRVIFGSVAYISTGSTAAIILSPARSQTALASAPAIESSFSAYWKFSCPLTKAAPSAQRVRLHKSPQNKGWITVRSPR